MLDHCQHRVVQAAWVPEALDATEPIDREILFLRRFEHLDRAEAVLVLSIDEGRRGGGRYVRALKGLKDVLAECTDEEEAAWSRSPALAGGTTSP